MRAGTVTLIAIVVAAGITASTARTGTTWGECEIAMKNVALNCGWWRLWKPVPIGLIRHGANLGTIRRQRVDHLLRVTLTALPQ